MDIGMRHMHVTAVLLLLVFMMFKTLLLLTNRVDFLDRIRTKTRVVDIILGVTTLITGFYLLTLKAEIEAYLWIKILLVLVAIPLGIVGLKRHKKPLALLSVLLITYVYGIGETQSYKFKRDPVMVENTAQMGQELYQKLCVECHGEDGKKGLFKAPDLSNSSLNHSEMYDRIMMGKGAMRGYKNELNQEQAEAIIEHINTLE